ncbi:hypothetical protein Ddye_025981 [Dipteronia dyeriana]|uniref:BED-type domain-containing protein n=1 Tax=Dipteronia dyeriana TaxID=168575 RepID=A0AAD9TLE2_9ROSI|nr:hypothetical protein Ddye_025981 [Dipteronia dyeriana]
MASGSGSGSGVRDIPPRHSVSRIGKGRMSELDPVQSDNISFDNTAYHEFLQRQAYLESLNYPANPNPPLIISELNASQPSPSPNPDNMTSQSENIPDFVTDPNFEEELQKDKKHAKSDIFVLHMKKVTKPDGTCWAVCNYCSKEYKLTKSGGYGTYMKHITTRHLAELAKGSIQSQIFRFSTPNTQLFKYSDQANREELARMVVVEHLPFSFGEKVGFIKYCQKALNPAACRVPRTTLTRTMYDIYKKEKRILKKYVANYKGRVSVCADIWTGHWRMHSYLGVTCHYMDKAWTI